MLNFRHFHYFLISLNAASGDSITAPPIRKKSFPRPYGGPGGTLTSGTFARSAAVAAIDKASPVLRHDIIAFVSAACRTHSRTVAMGDIGRRGLATRHGCQPECPHIRCRVGHGRCQSVYRRCVGRGDNTHNRVAHHLYLHALHRLQRVANTLHPLLLHLLDHLGTLCTLVNNISCHDQRRMCPKRHFIPFVLLLLFLLLFLAFHNHAVSTGTSSVSCRHDRRITRQRKLQWQRRTHARR